jgi:predicted  nucleic acid-binding Zn-ribbon protein
MLLKTKKQLNAELKSMIAKAQKGKITRRQYKVQRSSIESRLQGINRNIKRAKETFKGTTGGYADLVKQLDLAETDLAEAEEYIKTLESRLNKGEISLEVYKRSVGDYQKRRDKAESAINGILLRLREKIR